MVVYGSVDKSLESRHGVKPADPVNFRLGGPPSQTSALLRAARLGLEVENDVRVASERLSQLRHPLVPVRFPLPIIQDSELLDSSISLPGIPESEDSISQMPLL